MFESCVRVIYMFIVPKVSNIERIQSVKIGHLTHIFVFWKTQWVQCFEGRFWICRQSEEASRKRARLIRLGDRRIPNIDPTV